MTVSKSGRLSRGPTTFRKEAAPWSFWVRPSPVSRSLQVGASWRATPEPRSGNTRTNKLNGILPGMPFFRVPNPDTVQSSKFQVGEVTKRTWNFEPGTAKAHELHHPRHRSLGRHCDRPCPARVACTARGCALRDPEVPDSRGEGPIRRRGRQGAGRAGQPVQACSAGRPGGVRAPSRQAAGADRVRRCSSVPYSPRSFRCGSHGAWAWAPRGAVCSRRRTTSATGARPRARSSRKTTAA